MQESFAENQKHQRAAKPVCSVYTVAYAENFHGGFIHWHMVVICIWYGLFVTL